MNKFVKSSVVSVIAFAVILSLTITAEAKIKTMIIWADQMTPASGTSLLNHEKGFGTLTSQNAASVTFTLPVKLPVGAVVKSISFIYKGSGPSTGGNFGLYRTHFDDLTSTVMEGVATVSDSGNTGGYRETMGTVHTSFQRIVRGYRYWFKAYVSNDLSVIKAAKITYNVR